MGRLEPGDVVGNVYQIETQLGEGASARVYRSYHVPTDSLRVLKILRARLCTDDLALARFSRERYALSYLDHQHITHLVDDGEINGCPYLAFEYIPGRTLRELLARYERLKARYAVEVGAQVAEALSFAHSVRWSVRGRDAAEIAGIGILHGDLKPENILVDLGWQIKVLDFGLVEFAQAENPAVIGTVAGTLGYMAPEQLQGQIRLDGRVDEYALGVVLFEMLTGTLPYRAYTLEDLRILHVQRAPISLAHRMRTPHPQLSAVVEKALAIDPDERWDSMAAFAHALRSLQQY